MLSPTKPHVCGDAIPEAGLPRRANGPYAARGTAACAIGIRCASAFAVGRRCGHVERPFLARACYAYVGANVQVLALHRVKRDGVTNDVPARCDRDGCETAERNLVSASATSRRRSVTRYENT